jgi:hypothetical protein
MNDERQILEQAENQLRSVLEKIPAVSSIQIRKDTLFLGRRVDLMLSFELEGRQKEFIVEVKRNVTPKTLRDVCTQVRKIVPENSESMYPVVAASYLSESSIEVCKEYKVGCFDIQGNCFFAFGSLYVEIKGTPNANPSQRSIRTLFSPKSSRVARVLLSNGEQWWQIQEIAKEADISIGLVSDVKNRLLEEELILEQGKRVKVKNPDKLLKLWVSNYSYKKNKIIEYYSLDNPAAVEQNISAKCKEQNIRYALALFSGANKVSPFVRMERTFAFIDSDIESLAEQLNLKNVSSGANVILLRPFDEGIFYQSHEINEIQVVSNLQLYLDLISYKGRGEEAANAVYNKFLEPQWSQNQIMNLDK